MAEIRTINIAKSHVNGIITKKGDTIHLIDTIIVFIRVRKRITDPSKTKRG